MLLQLLRRRTAQHKVLLLPIHELIGTPKPELEEIFFRQRARRIRFKRDGFHHKHKMADCEAICNSDRPIGFQLNREG